MGQKNGRDTLSRKRDRGRVRRRILIVFVSLFFLFSITAGAIIGNFYTRSPFLRKLMKDYLNPSNIGAVLRTGDAFAPYAPNRQFSPQQHVITILLMGCDSDYYENRPVAVKGSNGRSDALLVTQIDFDHNTLHICSIPRDSAVHIPDHRGKSKVNAAHEWGGNQLAEQTVEQDFGIHSDYAVALHFGSFQKVVDAVHGVYLNVDKRLKYTDRWGGLYINLKPGYQHLTGYQAMGFVRMRHDATDFVREQRQHEFLEALKTQVTDPKNFFALPDVLNAITDDMQTDMTQGQMLSIIHWATQVPKQNIEVTILPSVAGRSYVYVDVPKATKMLADMFFNGDTSKVNLNVIPIRASLAMRQRTYSRNSHL